MVNEISPLNCVDFLFLFCLKRDLYKLEFTKNKHITLYLNILLRHIFIGNLSKSLIILLIAFLHNLSQHSMGFLDLSVCGSKCEQPSKLSWIESQKHILDSLCMEVVSALNSKNRLKVLVL